MSSQWLYRFAISVIVCLGLLCVVLTLFSCKTPYEVVAGKANPTEKEKSLLAVACAREFPDITTEFTIDSTIKATQRNYSKQIDSLVDLTEKLDSIIHEQIPIIDTVNVDSTNCLPRIKIAYQQIERLNKQRTALQASVNHLKSQLIQLMNEYEPCDSIIKQTFVKTECDSAMMRVLHDRTKAAEERLVVSDTKLQDKKKAARNWMWTAIGLMVLLAVGITLSVRKSFTKIIK